MRGHTIHDAGWLLAFRGFSYAPKPTHSPSVFYCPDVLHDITHAIATAIAAGEQPNVIFILADDLGYGDLGANGNPQLRTPNLDQLSRQGIRFTGHHVAPMCTPTRGELLSGVSAFRNGASAVAQGRSIIRRELPLMPEFFRDNGYATAHIGKWHLGDNYPCRNER